jgi:hypothetical protein
VRDGLANHSLANTVCLITVRLITAWLITGAESYVGEICKSTEWTRKTS